MSAPSNGSDGGADGPRRLELDRHLLASNATTWDTAWGTFGWTEALEGARASRIEEEVPWGTRSARRPHPPRLTGPPDQVLDPENLGRLGRSLLPVDGRLGFSIWGAVGSERVGSEWRVATHTVLFDADELRALAGYPDGLLDPRGRAADWLRALAAEADLREPVRLPPIRLEVGAELREAFTSARLREIATLRDAVLAATGGDRARLADDLANLYEALAEAVGGGRVRRVALTVDEGGAGRDLLRLVWLSLPLEDRLEVHYVTEQRRAERPPGHLLGLPGDEWGRFVPEDAWVLGAAEPVAPPSPGRRHWAELVAAADALEGFTAADRRAALRGWRVVAADDLRRVGEHARWRAAWREGPEAGLVEELARRERGRPGGPRAAAVGVVAGRAVAAGVLEVDDVTRIAADFGPAEREAFVRGVVRSAVAAGRPAEGGRIRVRVTEALGGEESPLVLGLRRFVDRESAALRALLRENDGPDALIRAAAPAAAAGDGVALELARVAVAEARWDPDRAGRLADALRGRDGVAVELVLALAADGGGRADVAALAGALLDGVDAEVVAETAPRIGAMARRAADGGRGAPDGAARPSPGAVEVLRRAALLRLALAGGSETDEAVAALVALGAASEPPAHVPAPWRELVEAAPAPWLSRAGVLGPLVDALDAGRGAPGEVRAVRAGRPVDSEGAREVASLVARRVLERAGPESLDDDRAEALLRLIWLEGDGATLRWLVGTRPDAAAPLLARLLVTPAPLPLLPDVRAALTEAMDTGADPRSLASVADELGRWAPALHERAGLSGGPAVRGERFVPLARPARAAAGRG